ncbi:MAG: DUF2339 domain-containing protein [Bacteroidia bacterium]|nr:DUF2339 domain-containing protein [Bacteroidia bacterium]
MENNQKLNYLLGKLDALNKRQESFFNEIANLRIEINALKNETETVKETEIKEKPVFQPFIEPKTNKANDIPMFQASHSPSYSKPLSKPLPPKHKKTKTDSELEKFIGENLINKIGIAITIIGVAIGAKYSIDHNLISPQTRIILGYLTGLIIMAVGMKLRKNYENFSAVLVSGAIAIMYVITFSAYSFFGLFSQTFTFILMVLFTAFTILTAISYNRQIIAHIGLVGAYAVPILLSDGSGKVEILFTYMAIINTGILIISFKKYWKQLSYSSFILTWLIYAGWYFTSQHTTHHINLAFIFLSVFFVIFYVASLSFKLIKNEVFTKSDVILIMANAFIFYGVGYDILNSTINGQQFLGLYTLGNAILHFIVSIIIYKKKLADKNLFFFITSLVIVFITISFPVQLNGKWVTLLWVIEATLLFWIGKKKKASVYEYLSYPLMLLALFSLLQDWSIIYGNFDDNESGTEMLPIANVYFVSTVIFLLAFAFIHKLSKIEDSEPLSPFQKEIKDKIPMLTGGIILFCSYAILMLEISNYWNMRFLDSKFLAIINSDRTRLYNYDLIEFKSVWLSNFSLLFFSLLALINIKKIKNEFLGNINLALLVLSLAIFLVSTLYDLSELRESYLDKTSEYYNKSIFYVLIRYLSIGFAFFNIYAIYYYSKQDFLKYKFDKLFDYLLHLSVLWILSSELINIMDLQGLSQSYKLGISILWGIYSLMLIVLGIWKRKQHLRFAAIILFGITLVKLFLYDISQLNTISKTIIFVSLGLLLLIISFLYNKYKNIISTENETKI